MLPAEEAPPRFPPDPKEAAPSTVSIAQSKERAAAPPEAAAVAIAVAGGRVARGAWDSVEMSFATPTLAILMRLFLHGTRYVVLYKPYTFLLFAGVLTFLVLTFLLLSFLLFYLQKDELAVFKGERKDLIRELKRVNFDLDQIDRNLFHLRGLEPYLSVKYNKYMQKKRTGVLNTVMSEQQTQRSRGVALKDYSEALRVACCEASAWARERAADLGRRDAKAVGHEPVVSTTTASKRQTSWGHESDISATPSMCSSTVSGSISTHSSLSISSEASMDSIRLRSPSMHKTAQRVVTLARVDELPSLPYSPASSSSSS